jgi:hypothetical protein
MQNILMTRRVSFTEEEEKGKKALALEAGRKHSETV